MKVGILTTHASMNFGALLQAYALRCTIADMGCDCSTINYRPAGNNLKEHPVQFVLQRKNVASKVLFGMRNRGALNRRSELCEAFRRDYLSLVPDMTVSRDELPEAARSFDVVCCGSDQIWNLRLKDNADRAFMLDFERDNRSISYAASFGDGLKTVHDELVRAIPLIKRFDAVSVREAEGRNFLSSNGVESSVVLDPTLLANASAWEDFDLKRAIAHPYVLVYGFETSTQSYDDLIAAAKRLSSLLGVPAVNPVMTPAMGKGGFENHYECGPIEFLGLIKNAEWVCTNSYHCMIFSILFEKPFVSVYGKGEAPDSRRETVLSMLGFEERSVVATGEWDLDRLGQVDNGRAFETLEEQRAQSREWLAGALGMRG